MPNRSPHDNQRPFDCHAGFEQAESYRQAILAVSWVQTARGVVDGGGPVSLRVNPVLAAFASEMYLKCMIADSGNEFGHHHELDKHYAQLLSETRQGLEGRFQKVLNESSFVRRLREDSWKYGRPIELPTLATTLANSSRLFVEWRYGFGNAACTSQNFIHQAQEALRLYVILDGRYPWAAVWLRDDWYYIINRLESDPNRDVIPFGDSRALESFPNEPKAFEKGSMLVENGQLKALNAK